MTDQDNQHDQAIGGGDSGSWECARKYYAQLVAPHALFNHAVRALRGVSSQGGVTKIIECPQLLRIYRSATCRAILYHAASSMPGQAQTATPPASGRELLSRFTAVELASVIAAAYLYRHVARKINPEIWANLSNDIQLQMEIGSSIGQRIQALGPGLGMLLGAVRLLGMALFSIPDEKAFKVYQRELRAKEKLFDLAYEQATWGCTHLQVASLMLQGIGFGIEASQGICAPTLEQAPNGAAPWFAMRCWIEAVLGSEVSPGELANFPNFRLSDDAALTALHEEIEAIHLRGPRFDWLCKGAIDLEPAVSKSLKLEAASEA